MVWSGKIDIHMVEMEWNESNGKWYLMGRDGRDGFLTFFSFFSLSYSSLSFSPPFLSFFLFVFFFCSFHIFFSFSSSLLFVYCKFFEKKKITF